MEQFLGQGLPRNHMEALGMRVNPLHRENEAALQRSCWYDYRAMHPVERTYLMAHTYREQARKFHALTVDERDAQDIRAFVPDDIFYSRDLTSMWNARRTADELGMPYPFVTQFAQERYFNRTQGTFPRPNQIYGEDFEIDIKEAWKAKVAMQITFASSPHFRMSAYRGELVQAQHLRFLVDQVKARPAPRHGLIARLLNEDLITPELAAVHFGQADAAAAEGLRFQ